MKLRKIPFTFTKFRKLKMVLWWNVIFVEGGVESVVEFWCVGFDGLVPQNVFSVIWGLALTCAFGFFHAFSLYVHALLSTWTHQTSTSSSKFHNLRYIKIFRRSLSNKEVIVISYHFVRINILFQKYYKYYESYKITLKTNTAPLAFNTDNDCHKL